MKIEPVTAEELASFARDPHVIEARAGTAMTLREAATKGTEMTKNKNPYMVDLGWTVSVNDCEKVMASEVGQIVREELRAMVERLAARGLPDVQVDGFGNATER